MAAIPPHRAPSLPTPPLSRPSGTRQTLIERVYDFFGLNNKFHAYTPIETIDYDLDVITSPVDAHIRHIGRIGDDGMFIGKDGRMISLTEHFGDRAKEFAGYHYMNCYLSPRNIHWWAFPYDGCITQTRIVEGRATIPTLLALEALGIQVLKSAVERNASIGSILETPRCQLGIIPIGSVNVNSMTIETDETKTHKKGNPYGYFRLGSTIEIIYPADCTPLRREGEAIHIGEPLLQLPSQSR